MSEAQFTVKVNAPDIEPRFRHPRIFEIFDGLNVGEFMELKNDHDPTPLFYQFMIERDGLFEWEFLEKGPLVWRASILKK
ncbi:DUF2249 domain-containing protein [Aquibacillus halophilus]|uniref:DUF2249 domain-containing protein n=1 Tax=Aquibacillus halophilus TaxID=930132 RepID=A0A6A8DHQ4_9BACI|nr:DUF2249 domain-containing protein [Aquibacillus halophilus]MRH43369.1 DUF2249 domain-containing protein [Aquibacillus halophilus]